MRVKSISLLSARKWLPSRPPDGHKGTFGRVYVLAGSRGMAGAAVLCAQGVLRAGAGLARLGIVASQQLVAARKGLLEVTTDALPENKSGALHGKALRVILNSIRSFAPTVLVVGPGLGRAESVQKIVGYLLRKTAIPMVLDADGLNVLASSGQGVKRAEGPLIVTPHPGELGRLTRQSVLRVQKNRVVSAAVFARKNNCVCVLKGAGTIVTDGAEFYRNTTGNAGMAKGGTGDVLAGLIGGLWAQTAEKAVSALRVASLGVFVHGLAGDMAAKDIGDRALLASELALYLPQALKKIT